MLNNSSSCIRSYPTLRWSDPSDLDLAYEGVMLIAYSCASDIYHLSNFTTLYVLNIRISIGRIALALLRRSDRLYYLKGETVNSAVNNFNTLLPP